jgi:hypothetical protein
MQRERGANAPPATRILIKIGFGAIASVAARPIFAEGSGDNVPLIGLVRRSNFEPLDARVPAQTVGSCPRPGSRPALRLSPLD